MNPLWHIIPAAFCLCATVAMVADAICEHRDGFRYDWQENTAAAAIITASAAGFAVSAWPIINAAFAWIGQ